MRIVIISSFLLIYSTALFAEGDPIVGKSKAIICVGCHGFDGNSSNSIYPKLAGQSESYLAKQLFDFKSGARKEEHMSSMVEAIQESEIPHIAAFFSSQKRKASLEKPKGINSSKYKLGQKIYNGGIYKKGIPACTSCHGVKGGGKLAVSIPSLMLQHSQYIIKTLKDFRSGIRRNDSDKMMRNVAANLSDKEIDALSSYIDNLNQP
jgi:cytochrome c553